jgi:hypothetical protein
LKLELNELLWKKKDEAEKLKCKSRKEELVDVLSFAFFY